MEKRSCADRLHELQKAFNWGGEEKDEGPLPTFYIKRSKKEIKKLRKEEKEYFKKEKKHEKKKTKKEYYFLLGQFDPETRKEIILGYDDKSEAVKYMKYLMERIQVECDWEYYDSPEDYCIEQDAKVESKLDPIVASGQWEAWEEYVATIKHPTPHKLHKKRQKFLKMLDKERGKQRKKYKAFELYDPLFRVRKVDEEELKKSLKRITKENMERRDRFLEQMESMYGLRDSHMLKSFKDKTKDAAKALTRYVLDMNNSAPHDYDDYIEQPTESFDIELP